MKKTEKYLYVETKNGVKSDLIVLPKAKFIAIVWVLIWGLLYHKFGKGRKAILRFTHIVDEHKIKLTYLKSTGDCTFSEVNSLMKELYDYGKANGVNKVETLIVNPFITQKILERDGWHFIEKQWMVGRLNKKNL